MIQDRIDNPPSRHSNLRKSGKYEHGIAPILL